MSKKIFDIIPPGCKPLREKKETKDIIKEKIKEKKKKKSQMPKTRQKRAYPLITKLTVLFLLFLFVLVAINSQAYAEITIQPLQQEKLLEVNEITISDRFQELDIEEKTVPGEFFEITKTASQEFSATGQSQEEGMAEGMITIYNNYQESINLKATTRFLSSEGGKYFQIPEWVNLPAASQSGGKTVPGTVKVEVVAMGAGEEYNIGPSQFSVPGLVGSPLYYQIHAESESSMTGGFSQSVKEITEGDIESANQSLKEELDKAACQELENKVGEGFVFLPSAIFERTVETSCAAEAGEKKAGFSCQGTAEIRVLAFQESFLKSLAQDMISKAIASDQEIIEELLVIKEADAFPNQEKGEMKLDCKFSTEVYNDFSQEQLRAAVRGKDEQAIKSIIFRDFPAIEKVKMRFWPFWVNHMPDKNDRIEITIQLDK